MRIHSERHYHDIRFKLTKTNILLVGIAAFHCCVAVIKKYVIRKNKIRNLIVGCARQQNGKTTNVIPTVSTKYGNLIPSPWYSFNLVWSINSKFHKTEHYQLITIIPVILIIKYMTHLLDKHPTSQIVRCLIILLSCWTKRVSVIQCASSKSLMCI